MSSEDHKDVQSGQEQISAVFPPFIPLSMFMYPFQPQEVPQLFLIFQQFRPVLSEYNPTTLMAWSNSVQVALITPDSQRQKKGEEAQTAVVTGRLERMRAKALQSYAVQETVEKDLILIFDLAFLHSVSVPFSQDQLEYGYYASVVIPFAITYMNAFPIHPPLHPLFPYRKEQSTSCCSDKSQDFLLNKQVVSMSDTAAKAQQDPHAP